MASSRKRRRRRKKRGGGGRAFVILLVVLLTIAAIIAAVTVFFRVNEIFVTGDSRYNEQDIVIQTGIEISSNMFLFNKFTAINRLFDEFPYLDEISIRRRLPDKVEIIVIECVPVAILSTSSGDFIIDVNGKLLEKVGFDEQNDFCVIKGVALTEPEVGTYSNFSQQQQQNPLFLLLNTALNNGILENIGEIDIAHAYDISFTYLERFTVEIGTTEELDKKLRYLDVLVNEEIGANEVGTIDVSDITVARFIREQTD